MAVTLISDLWTPAIWIPAVREAMNAFPALFNSGAVMKTTMFDELVEGAGVTVNVPFFKDITDQVDAIQVENTAPAIQAMGSGVMIAPALNRVTANGVTALAKQVSGEDIVAEITAQLGDRRLKQRQTTTVNILRGLFNVAGIVGAAAPLLANRLDKYSETGASPVAPNLFSAANFGLALGLLGELQDQPLGGAMWVHPDIYAALKAADPTAFERPSTVRFVMETYKGVPIFISKLLRRAGGVDGLVYDSYILAKGVIAYGEKNQIGDMIDAASLQYDKDFSLNNDMIYDRTRSLIHVNGVKWVGTAAGQSATNAELATPANWNLAFTTADRVGIVCIRTNG